MQGTSSIRAPGLKGNHHHKDGRYPEIMQSSLFYLSSLCSRFPYGIVAYSLETMETPSKVRANVT